MDRAVERGIQRREIENVRHVGMDEKSFGRGHDYVGDECGVGEVPV